LHEEKTALLLAGKIEHYTLEKRYISKDDYLGESHSIADPETGGRTWAKYRRG